MPPVRHLYTPRRGFQTVEEIAHAGQTGVVVGGTGAWTWVRFDDGVVLQVESIDLKEQPYVRP